MRSDADTLCCCLLKLFQSHWVQSESTAALVLLLTSTSALSAQRQRWMLNMEESVLPSDCKVRGVRWMATSVSGDLRER